MKLEQYPKNKDLNSNKMSNEQKLLRLKIINNLKYGNEIKCKCCGKNQALEEYYITNKLTGRRKKKCRDCQMKQANIVEIGRCRFAKKIATKGFRRCSVCKEIKPLTEYKKNKRCYLGISNNCYTCSYTLHSEFKKKQQETIGLSYIKEYGKLQGIKVFSVEILQKLKLELLDKRKPKYFVDNKEFITLEAFAQYIEIQYNLPITMTQKRISKGKTEEECKLTEYEMRSLRNKGRIKVTDCKTGEVFIFKHTKDKELLKMFSGTTITQYLKSGEVITREREQKKGKSKYRINCRIERI